MKFKPVTIHTLWFLRSVRARPPFAHDGFFHRL